MRSLVEKLGFGRKPQEIRTPYLYDVASPGMNPYVATFVEELHRIRPDLTPSKIESEKIPQIAATLSQRFYRKTSSALLLPPDLQRVIDERESNISGLENIALFSQDIFVFLHEVMPKDRYICYGLHASLRTANMNLFRIGNFDERDFEVKMSVASSEGTIELSTLGKDLLDVKEPVVWVANNHPYITFDLPTQPDYKV